MRTVTYAHRPQFAELPVEEQLKRALGPEYGGPSLGFRDGKFVLYEWRAEPGISLTELGVGASVAAALEDFFVRRARAQVAAARRRPRRPL